MVEDFARRYPDNAGAARMLGGALVAEGRLDEARAAFEKSQALNPLDPFARMGSRNVALMQDRWTDAEAVNQALDRSPLPFPRLIGAFGQVMVEAAQGRGQAMLSAAERAVEPRRAAGDVAWPHP